MFYIVCCLRFPSLHKILYITKLDRKLSRLLVKHGKGALKRGMCHLHKNKIVAKSLHIQRAASTGKTLVLDTRNKINLCDNF